MAMAAVKSLICILLKLLAAGADSRRRLAFTVQQWHPALLPTGLSVRGRTGETAHPNVKGHWGGTELCSHGRMPKASLMVGGGRR